MIGHDLRHPQLIGGTTNGIIGWTLSTVTGISYATGLLGKCGAEASQALFRPSEMETLAASAIIESRAGVVVGGALDYAKNLFATPATSGTQNMSNYASPTIGMDTGVPWGTNLLGDYTSSGILSCRKCQF